ncbi:MAG TPA: methylenetetrahydrofolate reductase [NAD(P)H] [Steroidobacteraceae bacterium]|nr:methylenetetrahydrofolate reductase [NAD(P)H] [Steroidobacteraceae bacterium]
MPTPVIVSFEFFPPADDAAARQLSQALLRLAPLQPAFISVTHGADGSCRTRTLECVRRIMRETDLHVAPHITCIGVRRSEVLELAAEYWRAGVRRLIALRGDAPAICGAPQSADFEYAADLVKALAGAQRFDLTVAAYPEGHPESGTIDADIENLKRKIDAGAHRAISQFFFDTDVFLRYRDRCRRAGIGIPIVPGILPIARFAQVLRFAARCGAAVPSWLQRRFEGLEEDPETHRLIAAHLAIEQIRRLRRHGVDEFHFYTLNRAELTYALCHELGLRPQAGADQRRLFG